jgi:hypothetical protein
MKVEVFCVCESARTEGAKQDLRGVQNIFHAPTFPHMIQAAMAVRIRFDRAEFGEHDISFAMRGPDGNAYSFAGMRARVPGGNLAHNWMAGSTQPIPIKLASPGEYEFAVKIDGTILATCIILAVEQARPPSSSAGTGADDRR